MGVLRHASVWSNANACAPSNLVTDCEDAVGIDFRVQQNGLQALEVTGGIK